MENAPRMLDVCGGNVHVTADTMATASTLVRVSTGRASHIIETCTHIIYKSLFPEKTEVLLT